MADKFALLTSVFALCLLSSIRFSCGTTTCPSSCECVKAKGEMNCPSVFRLHDEFQLEGPPKWLKSITFLDGPLACDCGLERFLRSSPVKVFGTCSEDREVHELNSEDIRCDSDHTPDILIRKKRAVPDEKINVTKTTVEPGGWLVFPCDFEEGYCQWHHSTDSDFHWERNNGSTPSSGTGPDFDHTTGSGWYVYAETSAPRRPGQAARLVSPTISPVNQSKPCTMELFIHMRGQYIGSLNIYQLPVGGFRNLKKSLVGAQGSSWFREEVEFDSDKNFQVVIEAVRGPYFQSDVALDDIKFSPGCRRLAPSYVRLSEGDFKSGRVEVYQKPDWKRVCWDGWTGNDTSVACRELGFETGSSRVDVSSSKGLPRLGCAGNEDSVRQCANGRHGNATWCSENKTAEITCSGVAPVCPLLTHLSCPALANGTAKCISKAQLCDFRKDCWDGSDESDCGNFTRCDFQSDLCGWITSQASQMRWQRHRNGTPSIYTGPNTDHKGNPEGYYLYTEVSGRTGGEKARIAVTPRFQGDHGGQCRLSFFYHMYGLGVGHLRVFARNAYDQREVWGKSTWQENRWMKAEVTLANMTKSFQVVFESEHGGRGPQGDIAIDDVSFTPECRPAEHENVTCVQGTFPCGSEECVSLDRVCDFTPDCFDGSDELNCGSHPPGRCDFELGPCDWTNATDEDFDWQRNTGYTLSWSTGPQYDHTRGYNGRGYYLYIEASSPRRKGDKARILSPQFMWAGVNNCTLRFYYHMLGADVGSLQVYLKNAITSEETRIWRKSGYHGNKWWRAEIAIATNWTVAQIVIEGVRGSSFSSDIAIDDISFSPGCYPSEDVHLVRNYDVRLVGAGSSFEGRVEIFRVGQWGTICSDEWDHKDADVVCRQLGYSGAEAVPAVTHYGLGKGQIWLDDLQCRGNETNLGQCAHGGWAQHNCNHSQDAGVRCSKAGSTKPVRLVDRNNTHGGRVEIYHQNRWGSICFDGWDVHDAFVVCRTVGYGGAKGIKSYSRKDSPLWLQNARCRGNEDSLGDCPNSGWNWGSSCSYGYAGVLCNDDGRTDGEIRLAGGSSPREGRVEIFYRGEWGTVCEDLWSPANARVVCYQLGFTAVRRYHQSFGPGTGRIWMNEVNCVGSESGLALCPQYGWGINSCLHDEDVGVICSDDAYIGCYRTGRNPVMPHQRTMRDLTPVKCLRYCHAQGFPYAGLTFATECRCGHRYDTYGKDDESKCDTPCPVDIAKKCGGPFSLSVYSTDPVIVPTSSPGFAPVKQSCSRLYFHFPVQIHVPISLPDYFHGNLSSGAIWSPGHPGLYPLSVECVWVLNLQPGSRVKIEFEKFQTESIYDFVEVRDGKRDYAKELTPDGGFNGKFSQTLIAKSSVMWIKFHSDVSNVYTGFKILYTATGPPSTPPPSPTPTVGLADLQKVEGGCRPNLNVSTTKYDDDNHNSGSIFTPGFPADYENNLLCHWVVYVVTGSKINIEFQQLDIQHSSGGAGPGDVLIIYDGVTHHTSTGRSLPWVFNSSSHLVRVIFSSDEANVGKGFLLKYERAAFTSATPPSTTAPTTPASPVTPLTTAAPTSPPDSGGEGKRDGREADKEEHKGLSGGGIAGIVLGILAVIVLASIFVFCFKTKKQRNNQGVRHGFVNEAYDNTVFGLEPTQTQAQAQASTQPPDNQTQSSHYEALQAPPPYSQIPPAGQYASPLEVMGPAPPVRGPELGAYAHLYSAPPAYETPVHGGGTTTTALGSVTSLRDVDGKEVLMVSLTLPSWSPVLVLELPDLTMLEYLRHPGLLCGFFFNSLPLHPRTAPMAGLPAVLSRPVLPPIRGTGEPEDAKKVALPDSDQAGPLPEKAPLPDKTPLSVDTPLKPSAPPRPPSAQSAIRVVSPLDPAGGLDEDVPFEFLCPLTNEIMKNPMKAADGYTYEKRAIRSWLRRHSTNPISPMTGEVLPDLNLQPDDDLRRRIEEFTSRHSVA